MPTIAFAGLAHIHTPGFINMIGKRSDIKVKSVWDHHAVRAQRRADELKATVASSVEAIAQDPEIDGVVVCSETDRHESIVLSLAKGKKHLFVEKPLGIGAVDAYRMANAIDAAGVKFQTGYFRRGDPVFIRVKQLIEEGKFGTITRARGSNCHHGAIGGWFDQKPANPEADWNWMADLKQAGVGAFGDLGTHMLDILMWMLGPVESVTATLDPVTKRYPGCDETGEALMRFKRGTIGTLAAGWVDWHDPVTLQISGTAMTATVMQGKLHLKAAGAKDVEIVENLPNALPHAFELFLDALTGKGVPLVGAQEAAERSAVMEAMYQAAGSHTWMTPRKA